MNSCPMKTVADHISDAFEECVTKDGLNDPGAAGRLADFIAAVAYTMGGIVGGLPNLDQLVDDFSVLMRQGACEVQAYRAIKKAATK